MFATLHVYNSLSMNDPMSLRNSLAAFLEVRKINKKCIVELLRGRKHSRGDCGAQNKLLGVGV